MGTNGVWAFLGRTQGTHEEIVEYNNTARQAHQQRIITTSFRPITPHATSQSRATHVMS